MRRYRTFLEHYQKGSSQREIALEALVETLRKALDDNTGSLELEGRVKGPVSTFRKMRRYDIILCEVHDLLGIRLVVRTVAQCYEALETIQELWSGRWTRVKDYIARPKHNGYQSLHIWIALSETPLLEIQIRSKSMHERCVNGAASHRRYKRELDAQSPPIKQLRNSFSL